MSESDGLARLSRAAGIADGFKDAFGDFVSVTPQTQRAILAGFGIACDSEGAIATSLAEIAAWRARP